ncbi:unnamed protein product [Leptidea sinapis]|uniref:GRAM domain-containing protein n=1 Tax=Leptidea sinapis TaxID=189913 RepID=A0A5E4PST4_9NEOP|nr:unnamed protein product [Leptidea sinapis]
MLREMVDNVSFEYSDDSSVEGGYKSRGSSGQAVKPFSGSAPSVQVAGLPDSGDATECKHPSKSRQKKFQRHFPQVGPEERVLNYYSCALVGDLLLQGHLYITKNYFAFYSNVFGYVTKLLIPTSSVVRITKEKVARIIPNAVGVCTKDERHVFGSLLSRDSTYKLMTLVWKAARVSELAVPKPQDIPVSEVEVSEYSPEDDSSSGGADHVDSVKPVRVEPEAIISTCKFCIIDYLQTWASGRLLCTGCRLDYGYHNGACLCREAVTCKYYCVSV